MTDPVVRVRMRAVVMDDYRMLARCRALAVAAMTAAAAADPAARPGPSGLSAAEDALLAGFSPAQRAFIGRVLARVERGSLATQVGRGSVPSPPAAQ